VNEKEKEKEEQEGATFEEVTTLLADIFKKVTDRGATTAKVKLHEAMTSFHGQLKRLDQDLEKGEEE
jgi:hypothetical protein